MRIGFATSSERTAITNADQLAADAATTVTGVDIVPLPWDLPDPPIVDAIVIRSTWGYHHDLPKFKGWLDSLKVPVLNPIPLMLANMNKLYLDSLEKNGISIVPTVFFSRADRNTLSERLAEYGWGSIVLKPTVSASSHLTYRLEKKELDSSSGALDKILERSEGMAQPFLTEILSEGEISAIFHKSIVKAPVLSHAVRKLPRTGDFRVQAEFGGLVEGIRLNAHSLGFCQRVLSQVPGEWLYGRVDFVELKQGPSLCELELIEPYLFYEQKDADLTGFAKALASHLNL